MSFRHLSEKITSKGLTTSKAVSLADLHRRRTETQSQYFTPIWVAQGIWQSLSSLTYQAREMHRILDVVDSNCGNGRLFEGAPLDCVSLYGLDTDKRCIDSLIEDTSTLNIENHFETGSISDLNINNFDIALINPAYSLHLESPNLTHFDTNSFGRFGPGTAALSHEYALAQAVNGADFIAAILPSSIDELARSFNRLIAVVYLPDNTFRDEGANVKTAVYFFGPNATNHISQYTVKSNDQWPQLPLALNRYKEKAHFSINCYDDITPTITLPVTHNPRIELHHHNRRIVLKFHCGLVQAKVLNALYQSKANGKRLPSTIQYAGQGVLLLDVLLMQDEPEIQLDKLSQKINALGGDAFLTPNLSNYYKKLVRRHKRAITPFYRTVKESKDNILSAKAKHRTLLNPIDLNSPSIKKGQFIKTIPKGGEYSISLNGYSVTLRRDEFLKRFEFITENDILKDKEWVILHKGLNAAMPELAHMHQKRIEAACIDWLADFQRFSLTEGLINPYGYIGGWEQGSGKARYAIALAMLHSGKNLIVVESGLMPEMIREFEKLNIAPEHWGILNDGGTPLKKVNLVSYPTLRKGLKISYLKDIRKRGTTETKLVQKTVRTNGERWKRLFNTVICDEGSLLSNMQTQQTKAVKALCGRKLIVLDGTPQRNYPRDLLPLSVISAGNGMSHQSYGVKGNATLSPGMINNCNMVQRGEDAFYNNHVVTQWVTNEFKEDLQAGAKREVPKINNLGLFREWLSPSIQRRLRSEPDLKDFLNCPMPIRTVINTLWDNSHLGHYLKTATEFAGWYKQNKGSGKALNMVIMLARIKAVQRAANAAHVESNVNQSTYTPITSKQRLAIERVLHYVGKNQKVILYATSPDLLARLQNELTHLGVKSVLFTGKKTIKNRTLQLDQEFRYGDTQVLLSSWVGQRGLNLEQASAVIIYERNFSATSEEQAIFRTQRPSQTNQVYVEYLHLAGSIDEYMAQLVEWKLKSSEAGLDFGEQTSEEEDFLHLDTILNRFCDEVLSMGTREAKEILCA